MITYKKMLMGIILVMLSPFFLFAQAPDPVSFQVMDVPESVQAGDVFTLTIEASIESNWHLYSVLNAPDAGPFPTSFTAKSPNFVVAGDIEESEAIVEYDPNFETDLGYHANSAVFKIPIAIKTAFSGKQIIDVEAYYQVCDDRVCLPPKKKSIIANITVEGVSDTPFEAAIGGSVTDIQDETANIQEEDSANELASDGVFSFMWIAILAGFGALLTPCVFPMIPLTVSYFSKQDGEGKGVGKALIFGLAIVITFTLIGMILAAVLGASGAQNFASNPFVNAFIAIVLIAFALSLLGMYELELPYQFTNYLNRKSNESSGIIGILFMAMTISAVSFSCTAPFVGAVFAATATEGQLLYPILGMIGFSAAFASPFVLFAMFPKWLDSLPKSGSWMNVIKVLLGFIELAAAIKFISNVDLVLGWGSVSRPFAIALWMAIFLIAGLYILGVFALKHETKPETISAGRIMLALPLLLFSFYLIPGLMGASLGIWDSWLPPKMQTDVSVVNSISAFRGAGEMEGSEEWDQNYEQALSDAEEAGIPVFIDFTGYTCTNCRAMESNVFPLDEVQERFGQMKLVQLYTDGGADAQKNQNIQFELTGNVALPTYVILDPRDKKVLAQELGYIPSDKFISFLDKGLERYK